MSVSLAMYAPPEICEHVARVANRLAEQARGAGIDRHAGEPGSETGHAELLAPDLLIGQTCGYPLTHALAGRVRYLATPVYAAPGCAGSFYRSVFLVRQDHPARTLTDTRGGIFAFNGRNSHSGWNAPRLALARIANGAPLFAGLLETGAHADSLAAVAEARADLCATDCVTLALLRRHRPAAVAGLRVLACSEPAPGLPYVTRAAADDNEVRVLRAVLRRTLADPALAASTGALLLSGVEVLPEVAYQRIVDMEHAAEILGYASIA